MNSSTKLTTKSSLSEFSPHDINMGVIQYSNIQAHVLNNEINRLIVPLERTTFLQLSLFIHQNHLYYDMPVQYGKIEATLKSKKIEYIIFRVQRKPVLAMDAKHLPEVQADLEESQCKLLLQ